MAFGLMREVEGFVDASERAIRSRRFSLELRQQSREERRADLTP